jgi:protein PhnA
MGINEELQQRSNSSCELCKSEDDLSTFGVNPSDGGSSQSIYICNTCKEQVQDDSKIDETHWHCLNDSMWSEHAAVQVMAYRMLTKLNNQDALDMLYLEEDVKAWADEGIEVVDEDAEIKNDANGNILSDGDSITVLKDLDVKGSHIVAKRGTIVKNIRIGNVSNHIEGKITGTTIYLKCDFIKKL